MARMPITFVASVSIMMGSIEYSCAEDLIKNADIAYGEYLAGDKGYTFDISRRFQNGVVMGAFFTKTDVTAEQFGEGSFDKGIYFKIPISGDWFNFKWRPLTKDPGAKLIRKDNLYHYLRKYKN